jgi:transcriptional regulator with XRE-family HTH domain
MNIQTPKAAKAARRHEDPNYQVTNNNPIDVHVGRRVRLRRTLLGMSQEQLGEALNITFQQVQKYERGSNRISSSRLWDIAQILDVPVSFFFDDMSEDTMKHSPRRMKSGEAQDGYVENPQDPMARRQSLELVRAFYQIPEAMRPHVIEMLRAAKEKDADKAS